MTDRTRRPTAGAPLPSLPCQAEPLEARQLLSATFFTQHNLVSDGAVPADRVDKNLVNPWGLASDTPGPLWVANNGTNTATLYDFDTGAPKPLVVHIKGHAGGDEDPTGEVYNEAEGSFVVKANGKSGPAAFLFAGEDGTVSAWAPTVDKDNTILVADRSNVGAVYKGLAQTEFGHKTMLYATDFENGRVDVFDSNFKRVTKIGNFLDPKVPKDFHPFGIQEIDGNVVVTYAKHVPGDNDEAHGAGFGYATVFNGSGRILRRLQHVSQLNAPWGVAKAPASWGKFAGHLLVGNFGNGDIVAFDPKTGHSDGTLNAANGKPIIIDGLWGLRFGNDAKSKDTLFLSAGINDEADGLFGTITPTH